MPISKALIKYPVKVRTTANRYFLIRFWLKKVKIDRISVKVNSKWNEELGDGTLNCYLESGGTNLMILGMSSWNACQIYSWSTEFVIRELERFLFQCNLPLSNTLLIATLIGEVVKGKG